MVIKRVVVWQVMNRDPHDWVERLRATCDRLGQDNTVLANDLQEATRHVEEVLPRLTSYQLIIPHLPTNYFPPPNC